MHRRPVLQRHAAKPASLIASVGITKTLGRKLLPLFQQSGSPIAHHNIVLTLFRSPIFVKHHYLKPAKPVLRLPRSLPIIYLKLRTHQSTACCLFLSSLDLPALFRAVLHLNTALHNVRGDPFQLFQPARNRGPNVLSIAIGFQVHSQTHGFGLGAVLVFRCGAVGAVLLLLG